MIAAKQKLFCSFCGKAGEVVRRLIAGPNGVFICDECVGLCNQILEREGHNKKTPPVTSG